MKVCVFGLWHLGCVTAACLAEIGHQVTGLDADPALIEGLRKGRAPLLEPGLDDLLRKGLQRGALSFASSPAAALAGQDLIWVTFDTPVDDEDRADSEFVFRQVRRLFPYLEETQTILFSSQLPVGSVGLLERECPLPSVRFACSPENLRLGKAIESFMQPSRIVAGVRREDDRARLESLWKPLRAPVIWMSVESAEMAKHAINAFLATSVAFTNELAGLCEKVGADAKEVERALRSEPRIGPRAYVSPGAAFAGGTLARDLVFLEQLGRSTGRQTQLISGVRSSNRRHEGWAEMKIRELTGDPRKTRIAVLGLTYKPGTDTLRRSSSIALCLSLSGQGFQLTTHDPAVSTLPPELQGRWQHCRTVEETLAGADILLLATPWPDYLQLAGGAILSMMGPAPAVIDPLRAFSIDLAAQPGIDYHAVGSPAKARPLEA